MPSNVITLFVLLLGWFVFLFGWFVLFTMLVLRRIRVVYDCF